MGVPFFIGKINYNCYNFSEILEECKVLMLE